MKGHRGCITRKVVYFDGRFALPDGRVEFLFTNLPPLLGLFFCMMTVSRTVSNLDFPHLDTLYKAIVKDKQPFERLEMTKEDLLEMFKVLVWEIEFPPPPLPSPFLKL